jgi:hypothetical protein
MFGLSVLARQNAPLAILSVLLGSGFYFGFQPVAWSMPTLILGESAAAATFGLINSMGVGRILLAEADWIPQHAHAWRDGEPRIHCTGLWGGGSFDAEPEDS